MVQQIKGAPVLTPTTRTQLPHPGGCSLLQQPDVSTRFCKSAPGLIVAVCSRNQKVLPGCERHLTATRPFPLLEAQTHERLQPGGGVDAKVAFGFSAGQLCKPTAGSQKLGAGSLCLSWTKHSVPLVLNDPGWWHTV